MTQDRFGPQQVMRTARLAKGLTLAALGQAAGLSPSYLSRLERGHLPIRGDAQTRIEQALDLNPGALDRWWR